MTLTSDSPASITASRALTVALAAGSGALVNFDFGGGDLLATPSNNQTGFAFLDSIRIAQGGLSPLGEQGLEFGYDANLSPLDDGWSEQKYTLGAGYIECYERISLYIPQNFEHLSVIVITVSDSADTSSWQVGDVIQGGVSDALGVLYYKSGDTIILNYPSYFNYEAGYWENVTLTNQSDASTATSVNKYFESNNNKFMALWQGDYSSNGIIIEYKPVWENMSYLGSRPRVIATGTDSHGSQPESASELPQGLLIEPSDFGSVVEYVVQRKKSTSINTPNGACRIWKNGQLAYKATSILSYSATKNYFENGYLLGYANSGFPSATKFYMHNYEFWGATKPPGLEGW